ncbi:hypothetical protein IP91_00365 [Pseudoduganella lurida]|uniref:Uncharacterized protein n=1 Tax=Pseudoduganella lurida TaxID=1036180 RepID=A0A562RJS8_9BURK|nr:hypothetical protein [Pseudoduganella lurida]TWI69298.1 hypothetical protein IP91_00365 [Pseudoduganella lurida]
MIAPDKVTFLAALLCTMVAGDSVAQQSTRDAYVDGKAYRPANAAIAAGIDTRSAAQVPGRDAGDEQTLGGLFGTPLGDAAAAKAIQCARAVRSATGDTRTDDARECAAINYLRRNPDERPRTSIDPHEPAVTRADVVRQAPRAFTADAPGLSGSYTACVDRTTTTPIRQSVERCEIGHAVTEGRCQRRLVVTYAWATFARQPGAEPRYARCASGTVRGDQLPLPPSTSYRVATATCAERGHGEGSETLVFHKDCPGAETLHGFDASACTRPPSPAIVDPPRTEQSCTTMPRTATNCFQGDGVYTGLAEVPVFEDRWDDTDCAAIDGDLGPITH